MSGHHFTTQLATGGEVQTTEIKDNQGRSHWLEVFVTDGEVESVRVIHPSVPGSSLTKVCELVGVATFADALACVETWETQPHRPTDLGGTR